MPYALLLQTLTVLMCIGNQVERLVLATCRMFTGTKCLPR